MSGNYGIIYRCQNVDILHLDLKHYHCRCPSWLLRWWRTRKVPKRLLWPHTPYRKRGKAGKAERAENSKPSNEYGPNGAGRTKQKKLRRSRGTSERAWSKPRHAKANRSMPEHCQILPCHAKCCLAMPCHARPCHACLACLARLV